MRAPVKPIVPVKANLNKVLSARSAMQKDKKKGLESFLRSSPAPEVLPFIFSLSNCTPFVVLSLIISLLFRVFCYKLLQTSLPRSLYQVHEAATPIDTEPNVSHSGSL